MEATKIKAKAFNLRQGHRDLHIVSITLPISLIVLNLEDNRFSKIKKVEVVDGEVNHKLSRGIQF